MNYFNSRYFNFIVILKFLPNSFNDFDIKIKKLIKLKENLHYIRGKFSLHTKSTNMYIFKAWQHTSNHIRIMCSRTLFNYSSLTTFKWERNFFIELKSNSSTKFTKRGSETLPSSYRPREFEKLSVHSTLAKQIFRASTYQLFSKNMNSNSLRFFNFPSI